MRLSDLVTELGGSLKGEDRMITGASTLEEATPEDITFLSNPRYRDAVKTSRAGALIVAHEIDIPIPQIVSENPYLYFARVVALLYPEEPPQPGTSPLAFIHPDAAVDTGACIYPHVYVGPEATVSRGSILYPGCYLGSKASVGEQTICYPNVVIYDGCTLGSNCIIHSGVVIGSDGFGFVWDGFRHVKIPQKGIVTIGDHVEIGSNCTIDRAALTSTRIGTGVKMDNLIQVGHNVVIGDHTIIVSQTGISGSAQIGSNVVLAGQCGIGGHITIGDGCVAAARAGIASDLAAGSVVSGFPAMDHRHWLRVQKVYKDLPEMLKRIRSLERRLESLGKD